jgi:TRAP transporter TAXI family solute receptor
LTFDDIDVRRLSFKESGDGFSNKQLDAFFVTAGVPNTAIVELTVKTPVKLLNVDGDQAKALKEKYPFYTDVVIAKDVYNTAEDINTIAIQATLVCGADLSEDAVYKVTAGIFDNLTSLGESHAKGKEVAIEKAVQGVSVAFHPGAEKYFKEKGVL